MFRFYKLYSLYMNNMASGLTCQREWCLCEKLPRAMLHVPVNRHLLCEVCGLARRPPAEHRSSSDEEAELAAERQKIFLEQRRAEQSKKSQLTRVKVAIKARKPNARTSCRTNCVKCGGLSIGEQKGNCGAEGVKSKLYSGRHGLYSKPKKMPRRQQEPTAPPPSSPSPSPPPSPPSPPSPPPPPRRPPPQSGSPWKEMPNLVTMAQDVFVRKNFERQSYSNLFVSNFIPLTSPITSTSGGAISKRSRYSSCPPRCHRSRPLPPLAQVLTNILASQKSLEDREKGGGLNTQMSRDSLDIESELASQFCPFDQYEGPSEDALVVNSARYLLHRPNSLYIEPRRDLHNNRIESLEFQLRSGYGSASPSLSKVPSNSEVGSLSGIQRPCFFMPKAVRKNLIKTINQIGGSSSSKNSTLSSDTFNPSILRKTGQENDAKETGKSEEPAEERSSIFASIMDHVFRSRITKSSSGNSRNGNGPDLDQLNHKHIVENHSTEDQETNSFLSDVSTDQTVLSLNKTKPHQDYSKRCSTTQSCSSSERDFNRIGGSSPKTSEKKMCSGHVKSKSISTMCDRCGNHRKVEDPIIKKGDIFHKKLDESTKLDENQKGNAIRQKLDNKGGTPGKKESIEQMKSPKVENYEEEMDNKKRIQIPKRNNIKRQSIHTIFQRKGRRISFSHSSSSQTHCKTDQCVRHVPNIIQTERKESKIKPSNKPLIVNNQPVTKVPSSTNSGRKEKESVEDKVAGRDANLTKALLPVNSFRLCRHKDQLISWSVVKTFETVSHVCAVIPKLHIASFVIDLVDTSKGVKGYIKESCLTDRPFMSLFEFRRPDIDPSELESHRDKAGIADDESGPETPVPHLATPKGFSRSIKQRKKRKNPCLPVWPAHPLKYRSRKIQYEELELSFDMQPNEMIEPNESFMQQKKRIQTEEIITSIYDDQKFSQSDIFWDMSAEEEAKAKPIKLIKGNSLFLNSNKPTQSDIFNTQDERTKWNTSKVDLESIGKEPKEKSLGIIPKNPVIKKIDDNHFKEQNPRKESEISQILFNQVVPITDPHFTSSKVSDRIRKQIDNSLQLKLKKMMTKPIKLLTSTESSSVSKFLEPFSNKLASTEEKDQNSLRNSLSLNPKTKRDDFYDSSKGTKVFSHAAGITPSKETEVDNSEAPLPSTLTSILEPTLITNSQKNVPFQKPLRLITNITNSSSSSDFESNHISTGLETDSDAPSEPKITHRTTEYIGLPALNWQVISLGLAKPSESIEGPLESTEEEEYVCPVYMCMDRLKFKTFASHFDRCHKHKGEQNGLPQEYFHRVVEGLPKQFSFDGDLLTKGNSFVSLLYYSSLTKDTSLPIRDYPLALIAAPQTVNDEPSTRIFFWLVGFPSSTKLLAKLTVYDPLEHFGRSRIIKPRDLSQSQDPLGFVANSKDHLLITVPHKKRRRFQITVVIDEL
ncbi:uncharacterized protein LOC108044555 isoform X2 [Drosophila rhopaloa]|uniref:Uncharacterized protein LOC108044555 isoform X2 n=1 Tax=Drosophila rhopaloa TaxID=1041015 RepID=A0A6P4ELM7_DRORH|nr:uncharacterized protein LOC108044555 isoform X2 [Drosophila rhopaloa]